MLKLISKSQFFDFIFSYWILFILWAVMGLSLLSCNAKKDQTNIEIIQNMMDQISIKPQDWDPKQDQISPLRLPPEGSIPRNFDPYPYKGDPEKASQNLKNPLKGRAHYEVLPIGKKHYETFCTLCHGEKGQGNGHIASFMIIKPPSLLSQKAKNFTDGRMFHIITDGQGVMGSYILQVPEAKDRWALVSYIRKLQSLEKQ